MTSADLPKAPKHLSKEAKRWWAATVADYELDAHHLRLLQLAAEAWDTSQKARALVKREGMVIEDRFGAPKAHPAAKLENDAATRFVRILRELQLDDGPAEESRPPAIAGPPRLRAIGRR